ncbi:MAG TPA: hypothetical protein VLJ14_18150 [Ktedonobacterales bacterium]|jgi:hypothetical protein|nr:hypothetical protein [Ktedonobacterales bacterium]
MYHPVDTISQGRTLTTQSSHSLWSGGNQAQVDSTLPKPRGDDEQMER